MYAFTKLAFSMILALTIAIDDFRESNRDRSIKCMAMSSQSSTNQLCWYTSSQISKILVIN